MSELSIDNLFNDEEEEREDVSEIGEVDEDALLQDDDDVLSLQKELGESMEIESNSKQEDAEEPKSTRQDKFATERKMITAPEPESSFTGNLNNNKFKRLPNNRNNRGRGMRPLQYNNQGNGRQFMHNNQRGPPGKNKTVLINPRFQGVVHWNSNARLAWDAQQQQQQQNPNNPWVNGAPPGSMGPPAPHQQQMNHFQPPRPQQFQPPRPQQFQPPRPQTFQPPMQRQQLFQPPLQLQGPQQVQFMPPYQNQPPQFMQQMHNGMPQQTNLGLEPPPPYWDGQNYVPPMQQGPNQQMMPYQQQNFFEPQPNIMINTSQPPPQIEQPNFQYNNQHFNNQGPPPMQQFPPMQQPPRMQQPLRMQHHQTNQNVFVKNFNNYQGGQKQELFNKRKGNPNNFSPQKKRLVHDRLGPKNQSQLQVKNITINTDNRPSVVKEVTVTNVTTLTIEDDQETRDLRMKIEEQRKAREQLCKWKELRRQQNLKDQQQSLVGQAQGRMFQGRGRGGHQQQNRIVQQFNHQGLTNTRQPVLQQIKQIDDQSIKKLTARRVVTAGQLPLQVEEPNIQINRTFLQGRRVLAKDESLMNTRRVAIKNIATSTGDKKIIQICKNIGEVQKLHRDKGQATITFKSVASAHAFFKKYQRHMLDLSMIEVSLTPDQDEQH